MSLGPIVFAAPWALWGLLLLPALFWLLRASPPPPRRVAFPPLRLLIGLETDAQSRERAPPWLLLLRGLILGLAIVGFAKPSLTAPQARAAGGAGPVLIVIDDGWTLAPHWPLARAAAEAAIADAAVSRRGVHVLLTTGRAGPTPPLEALTPSQARGQLARMAPQAWGPDPEAALAALETGPQRYADILWIQDGLERPGGGGLAAALARRGPLAIWRPPTGLRTLTDAALTAEGIAVSLARAGDVPATGAVAAETLDGRALGAGDFRFPATSQTTTAHIALPAEIAARAARLRIVGEASAGAVRLIPAGAGRPMVGLIDPEAAAAPALLSDLFYIERAIAPFASPRRADLATLIEQGAPALIAADLAGFSEADDARLRAWVEQGGLLVRFAGPRLANAPDALLPVRLRAGARALGGALAWETPQPLAPFGPDSPFAGLAPAADATIRQQVLADPADLAAGTVRVWARLPDGAPVVTAAPMGQGMIVLFHVTAGPAWSDLPLSGLYVDMLRRTLVFAGRAPGRARAPGADEPWLAERLIDGYGAFQPVRGGPVRLAGDPMAAIAGPTHPPGIYARAGAGAAIQAMGAGETLRQAPVPAGARVVSGAGPAARDLSGWLLSMAAVLFALDLIVALGLSGRLRRALPAAGLLAMAALAASLPAPAFAQADLEPTLTVQLGYIRTGDARLDRRTAAGLEGLIAVLRTRTAVAPGPPAALDPARDDLSPYPLIYWAAPDTPRPLSPAAAANLDRYMRLGGLLALDTRDGGDGEQSTGAAAILMRGMAAPPLSRVDGEHVLSRSFYLLKAYPGRFGAARLWAETEASAAARDGVPALLIGDGDWAGAWAEPPAGMINRVERREREFALRFGVNLVMVALTGNYKADQVHLPALLERLGEREPLEPAPP